MPLKFNPTTGQLDLVSTIKTLDNFVFGRSGSANGGTYLQNETIPSNISGPTVYLNGCSVKRVFVSNELSTTFQMEVLSHDGNGIALTSLGIVTVAAARKGTFNVNWPIALGKEIAVRVANSSPNSPKNVYFGIEISGNS
jgi:hypothetical protein